MQEPQKNSAYRESGKLLRVPGTMGLSHGRTQTDLLEETDRPDKTVFHRTRDYLKIQVAFWVWHYLKSRFGGRHEFLTYETSTGDDGIYRLSAAASASEDEPVRVALIGDWASGTRDADAVAKAVGNLDPHFTIHLGDIYYVGTKKEIYENMLGGKTAWPLGRRGSFALNANHEMYARGKAYFRHLLPRLGVRETVDAPLSGQKASFFCLRNDHWLVIGLDTGYYSVGVPVFEKLVKPSCRLHDALLEWLRDELRLHEDHDRGIVLLSHHQYYSQFESDNDRAARQLAQLVDRPVLWFWGHEHRFALYGKGSTRDGAIEAFGRCIGHGGLPIEDISEEPSRTKQRGLILYDHRERGTVGDGETPVGYNGFANLIFDGATLTVEHWDTMEMLVRETWRVADGGYLVGVSIEQLVEHDDIVLHEGAALSDALE